MNKHYDHFQECELDTYITDSLDLWYAFNDTIFYAEKGGMPSDIGYINGEKVIGLKWIDGTVYHTTGKNIEDPVHLKVDYKYRYQNTAVQTALHIVDGFCKKKGFEPGSIGTKPFDTWYEINDKNVTEQDLIDLENYVNEAIKDKVNITFTYLDPKDYPDPKYHGLDAIRIVTIGKYDSQPCGTLHLNNTEQIIHFTILYSEHTSRGTRIHVTIAQENFDQLKQLYKSYRDIKTLINPGQYDLYAYTENLLKNRNQLKKDNEILKRKIAGLKADKILNNTDKITEIENDYLKDCALLLSKQTQFDRCLYSIDNDQIAVALISKANKAKELFESLKDKITVKGGGSPQCVFLTYYGNLETLLNILNEILA